MRLTSLAVCAALVGGMAAVSTPASAQYYGYGAPGYGGGYGVGYAYRPRWQPNPYDPTRAWRERRLARENAWRANAAAAAGDYYGYRHYSHGARVWDRRSRIDRAYSGY
ncbi:hypothetical protein ASG52_10660 [Methylobacterium sp. Leaf456]|uniref:hypothetical protein n=1 Tax=Methylobacterium sp. Leaf456 TaxID=1736382 RepID=UPI0006F6D7FB|nr:hypothetical protein [Methylobacterium sp. Leaf456]KQT47725.1 hypothetical protein ASG52_10660 [Methylobacterium sp. Leaf456]